MLLVLGDLSAYFQSRGPTTSRLTRSLETRTGVFEISVLSNLLQVPIAVWNQTPVGGETVLQCVETHGEHFEGEALHVVYNGFNHYEVLLPPGLQRPVDPMDSSVDFMVRPPIAPIVHLLSRKKHIRHPSCHLPVSEASSLTRTRALVLQAPF